MVSIKFVGYIGLFDVFEEKGIDPFKEVILPKSDYNIGNFEFIIPNNREKLFFDVSNNNKTNYIFFKELHLNKFNAFSLANNHCMNYGVAGCEDVISVLNEKKIDYFGYGNKNFNLLTFNIKGISFAVIAFVKQGRWNRNQKQKLGPDSYQVDEVIAEIKRLKQPTNHVIEFPHWGTELVDMPDPKDVANARAFIGCGATAVIGHHPHIIQGIENYNNGLIAYSLGSFIYVPEKEVGYSASQCESRNYSMCLNLKFNLKNIIEFKPTIYKYCKINHILKEISSAEVEEYLNDLNKGINQKNNYSRKVRKQLFRRELKSFAQRFKSTPIKNYHSLF